MDVENVGARPGDEVAQLYVRDLVASVSRPVQELEGFERITLGPGERKTVRFALGSDQLGFLDREMKRVVEPGTFRVRVGTSSEDGLEAALEVVGN